MNPKIDCCSLFIESFFSPPKVLLVRLGLVRVQLMNIAKVCVFASLITSSMLTHVYAEEAATLPTIKVMADAKLRDEVLTTVQPFQEDIKVRKTLQHYIIKKEQGIQNYEIGNQAHVLNVAPQTAMPDMSHLSPLQQEYVLAVAAGLQSSDPSSGIFKMLEPLGIDREKALNHVQSGGGVIQINLDQQRLTQLLGDQWRGVVKN